MMCFDAVVLLACLSVVIVSAIAVGGLRPVLRRAVLAGTVALLVQAWCPPCTLPDGSAARVWMTADVTYRDSAMFPVVNARRQAIWMSRTVAVVAAACALLEWRHRASGVGTKGTPSDPPSADRLG